ncbi:MAG: universal stress protein [Flavobacteriaceae bacterium]|nr:universal stress protein [Flavobacteriaceae bacterium]
METQNRVLALINIKEPVKTIIESTINLAQTYGAEVKFLYVEKRLDPTRTENQLDVLRTMTEQQKAIGKFRNILAKWKENTDTKLDYAIVEGSIKKTVQSEIEAYQPDLMVLGKRKPNMYRVIGNQVTEFVIKNFDGPLFIIEPSKVLEIKENLSVGVLNDASAVVDHNLTTPLLRQSKEPLKLFKIANDSEPAATVETAGTPTIDYTFENNPNALDNLTSYVHKNNVHLFCLDRQETPKAGKSVRLKEVLKRINTSMLMVGNNNSKNLVNI